MRAWWEGCARLLCCARALPGLGDGSEQSFHATLEAGAGRDHRASSSDSLSSALSESAPSSGKRRCWAWGWNEVRARAAAGAAPYRTSAWLVLPPTTSLACFAACCHPACCLQHGQLGVESSSSILALPTRVSALDDYEV